LVSGILQHFGIVGDTKDKLLRAPKFWDNLSSRGQGHVTSRLQAMGFTEQVASSLAPLLEAEVGLSQLSSMLRTVTKRKGEAGEAVKEALSELKSIETRAMTLGLSFETVYCVRPGQGHIFVSGVIIQLVRVRQAKSGSKTYDIIAAGGRYDSLVRNFAENIRLAEPDLDPAQSPRATGMSISVDKLVNMVKSDDQKFETCHIVMAGDSSEASKVAKELWTCGIKVFLFDSPRSDEAIEVAKEHGVECIVMVASDGSALISQVDKEGRMNEKKIPGPEVLNHLCNLFKRQNTVDIYEAQGIQRQESIIQMSNTSTNGPVVSYNFEFLDREKYQMVKKKMEVRKSEKLATALAKFDRNTQVEVIAVGYPNTILRNMALTLELDIDKEALLLSLEELIKMYPRFRKDFRNIVEMIASVRFTPKAPVIVLFSLDDNTFKILC